MFEWLTRLLLNLQRVDFQPGDVVLVKESPGAPFDIGKRFTVSKVDPTNRLPIQVRERRYCFSVSWLEKTEGRPDPAMQYLNGHEMLDGRCVACDAVWPVGECIPPK